jgi:hypothetical protein
MVDTCTETVAGVRTGSTNVVSLSSFELRPGHHDQNITVHQGHDIADDFDEDTTCCDATQSDFGIPA